MPIKKCLSIILSMLLFIPMCCVAVGRFPPHNDAHVVWMLVSTLLVLMMTIPGLALFYGGLVQRKNVLSILGQCFAILAIASLMWFLFGFSLVFADGGEVQSVIGGFSDVLLKHVDAHSAQDLPLKLTFAMYLMGFAIITPALIVGGFAERMKFISVIIFIIFWEFFSYYPIAHWVWGGGWLDKLGVLDFAGGMVVHENAGVAGLVAAIMLGRRSHMPRIGLNPHNVSLVAIGTSLLWIGWFGFNAGGAHSLSQAIVIVFNTQLAASAGLVTWMAANWIWQGKPSVSGLFFGAIAGLVAITPACAYVGTWGSIIIGFASSFICYAFSVSSIKRHYDDALDAFSIHGVGGIVGSLLTGIFAARSLGGQGFMAGRNMGYQFAMQLVSVITVVIWTAVVTSILLKLLDWMIGIRVSYRSEEIGLDQAAHGSEGYDL